MFICKFFFPIIVDDQSSSKVSGDVGIFGTKKAGKSALINALLGNEYAISSLMLPTPNKVTYSAANTLIALNRVDEIFDSEESKSYKRVADYIYYRLTALGYENFLVIGVSAIQSVYFDEITRLIEPPVIFLKYSRPAEKNRVD